MKTLHTIYTNFAKRLALVLTLLLTLGVTQVWAADELAYTITFSNSANGVTSIATTTQSSTVISSSSTSYVTNKPFSDISNAYYGGSSTDEKSTIRVGKSGDAGKISIALSNTGAVKASKIVVNCKLYSSSKAATLALNNQTAQNVPSSYGDLTFNIDDDITTLDLSTSKYVYVKSISVYKTAAPSTFTVTCQSNNISYGAVSQPSVTNVANNTAISANGNKLTVGSTTVTATPKAQDANYTYAFSNWSGIPAGGKVTADVTVTANFTRTARALTNYRTSCSTETVLSLRPQPAYRHSVKNLLFCKFHHINMSKITLLVCAFACKQLTNFL